MKFGVREICDVVLRAKAAQKIGNKVFYKNEPVIYFDSLKTSSLEGQSTTVYAQGGRGNARLIGWDGERTVTFTMEDALISPIGISILTGAGLIEATTDNTLKMHTTEIVEAKDITYTASTTTTPGNVKIKLTHLPFIPGMSRGTGDNANKYSAPSSSTGLTGTEKYNFEQRTAQDYIYVMILNGDEPDSEPYIPSELQINVVKDDETFSGSTELYEIVINARDTSPLVQNGETIVRTNDISPFDKGEHPELRVLVDYYVEHKTGAYQVDISPESFGCNFYLEASTLFRDTNGVDMPAEFIIPNCKVQSNFTFSMASSGDPSTFTFTMDAFPDYTRWNSKKKVLAAIQVLDTSKATSEFVRPGTIHNQNVTSSAASNGYTANNVYEGTQKRFIEVE